ncbi:hypothetical protein [Waddlia chondrophila]|uniref:Uncharacterized protein n=1 Tax=Waddlia chondrophila (strain ATCC VR-1470 / WSU 86-1044) TaxID=716544 RepID=D6YU18_WADCW|nr:hypothetical protein [Waddlia chondrophila]ADI37629.1 hypothetical protein wcw_0254 [Waddlia chondrophila WSU 86-1044]
MSIDRVLLICLILAAQSLFASTKTASLRYLPNTPVHLASDLKLDISQSLPGLSLSTKGVQRLEADLTLRNEQPEPSSSVLPLNLTFVLKKLSIDLQANDETLTFRSDEAGTSLYLTQLSKLIDRPIQLKLDRHFQLSRDNEELRRAVSELPVLAEMNPDHLLVELFSSVFVPGNQELSVGQVIRKDLSDWEIPSLPKEVVYTITKIDDYSVYAEICGEIEKKKFQLSGEVVIGGKGESVAAALSGLMEGKVKWNRDNAMLYELELNYSYSTRLQLASWDWLMNVSLNLHNKTIP